jgi:hypothetical protein
MIATALALGFAANLIIDLIGGAYFFFRAVSILGGDCSFIQPQFREKLYAFRGKHYPLLLAGCFLLSCGLPSKTLLVLAVLVRNAQLRALALERSAVFGRDAFFLGMDYGKLALNSKYPLLGDHTSGLIESIKEYIDPNGSIFPTPTPTMNSDLDFQMNEFIVSNSYATQEFRCLCVRNSQLERLKESLSELFAQDDGDNTCEELIVTIMGEVRPVNSERTTGGMNDSKGPQIDGPPDEFTICRCRLRAVSKILVDLDYNSCPISGESFDDETVLGFLPCGHGADVGSLKKWFQQDGKCHVCRSTSLDYSCLPGKKASSINEFNNKTISKNYSYNGMNNKYIYHYNQIPNSKINEVGWSHVIPQDKE